jgi:hypothetical protein
MTSPALQVAIRGNGSAEIPIELVTLEHPDWEEPIRVCNFAEEGFVLVSRGHEFHAYPFELAWPTRDPDNPFAGGGLRINNVVAQDGTAEPLVLAALRGLPNEARARFERVLYSSPDVVEERTTRMRLTGITYNETVIQGALRLPSFSDLRAGYRATPDQYRNLRAG